MEEILKQLRPPRRNFHARDRGLCKRQNLNRAQKYHAKMFEPHENEIRSAKLASRDAKRARKRFAKNSLERKKFPKRDGCWPCKLTKKNGEENAPRASTQTWRSSPLPYFRPDECVFQCVSGVSRWINPRVAGEKAFFKRARAKEKFVRKSLNNELPVAVRASCLLQFFFWNLWTNFRPFLNV